MNAFVKALLLIALFFVTITFATHNLEPVTLRYYRNIVSPPTPLYLVIYLAIILGLLAGMAIDVSSRVSLRRRVNKLEKSNALLQEELEKIESKRAEERKKEEPESGPSRGSEPEDGPSREGGERNGSKSTLFQ